MNCKPGDLAINIGGNREGNIGKIVSVVRPYLGPQLWKYQTDWYIEYQGCEYLACDAMLRPIRPQSDEKADETLQWAPVPGERVTA